MLLIATSSVVAAPAKRKAAEPRRLQSGRIEQQLIDIEKKWNEAYRRKDVAALNRILADDIIIIYGDGTRATKSEDIARTIEVRQVRSAQ